MSLPLNQVIVGDCTEVMKGWSADSIDLVVTSPPYWGLRDYGSETVRMWECDPECVHEWEESLPPTLSDHKNIGFAERSKENYRGGGHKTVEIAEKHLPPEPGQLCIKCGAWYGSLGLEPHPQMFIDHLVEICREIKRVLKPMGTFWLNLGDTFYASGGKGGQYEKFMPDKGQPAHYRQSSKTRSNWLQPKQKLMIPSRVAIALQHDGWILRSDIIWHKPNHMPSSVKDRLTSAYEHVFLFAKQGRYYFDLDAIRKPHQFPHDPRKTRGDSKVIDREEFDGGYLSSSLEPMRNIRFGQSPKGKNPGDVWKFEEENLTKHDRAVERVKGSYTDSLHMKASHPMGKNPGDLWRIPTSPFPGAHFATFPPRLIEPIIKVGSPRWICSKCGKPRERVYEKISDYKDDPAYRERKDQKWIVGNIGQHSGHSGRFPVTLKEQIGWSDCGCGEKWDPSVVLDPFGGSGTVGQVARRLGRRFILIEIIPEYCKIAEQRVRGKYKPVPESVSPLTQFMVTEK